MKGRINYVQREKSPLGYIGVFTHPQAPASLYE